MSFDFEALAKIAFEPLKVCLGIDIIYRPKAGGVFKFKGIFDDRAQEVDPDTEQVVSSNVYSLGIKLDDLPNPPKKGDKIEIKNIKYRVIDSQEDGAPGVSTVLILHREC